MSSASYISYRKKQYQHDGICHAIVPCHLMIWISRLAMTNEQSRTSGAEVGPTWALDSPALHRIVTNIISYIRLYYSYIRSTCGSSDWSWTLHRWLRRWSRGHSLLPSTWAVWSQQSPGHLMWLIRRGCGTWRTSVRKVLLGLAAV